MKKFLKQFISLALAIMMLVTAVPMGKVEAKSKKLSKKDFEYTLDGKKHNFFTKNKEYGWAWSINYEYTDTKSSNSKYNKVTVKTFKTKRGIKWGSTEAAVKKQYGKTTKKKNKTTEQFYKIVKYYCPAIDTSAWKNYLEYTYKEGKDDYRIRFYLDKKNKVTSIVYFKNLKEIYRVYNYPNKEAKTNLSFKAPKGKKIKTETIGGKKVYIIPKGTKLCWNKKNDGVYCDIIQYSTTGGKIAQGSTGFGKGSLHRGTERKMDDVLKGMYRVSTKTGFAITYKNGAWKYLNPDKLGTYRFFVMICRNTGEYNKKAPSLIYFRYE